MPPLIDRSDAVIHSAKVGLNLLHRKLESSTIHFSYPEIAEKVTFSYIKLEIIQGIMKIK